MHTTEALKKRLPGKRTLGDQTVMMRPKGEPEAEALAIQALMFFVNDPSRLGGFLESTGLDPANIRAAAAEPGFLAAVLSHLSESESSLLEFCANSGVAPESIERARQKLVGLEGWQEP
ncbi:MAG: DUF3572 domain-containing protein [Bosea sp. (in: a-proteobacteria)]